MMTTTPATETVATTEQPRPRLEVCLDQYFQVGDRLKLVSSQYQHAKRALLEVVNNPAANPAIPTSIHMMVGGAEVPVPRPADPAVFTSLLEDAVAALGAEVIDLWAQAHGVTSDAVTHCKAAQALTPVAPPTQS